jgi:hypothetical protein
MGKQAFLTQLQHDASDSDDLRLEQQRQAWIADLQQLIAQMERWLADPNVASNVDVERKDREIAEDGLAVYAAPSLTLSFRTRQPRKVQILPRAMQVVGGILLGGDNQERRLVGASGRVDLVCGAGRETLLRFVGADGTLWRWLRADLDDPLDEESFFEALRRLLA